MYYLVICACVLIWFGPVQLFWKSMDCSLPGSLVHGILQARILESVAISFSICIAYCCSVNKWCPTLCDPWSEACQASLSFTISWSLLRFMSTESVTLSNHLILCHPLLLLPSIFPSIRVFSNESAIHTTWSKHWSVSFGISPSSEYLGLISFRIDWFDLLAVQGTLKSLLQHQNSKALCQCNLVSLFKIAT